MTDNAKSHILLINLPFTNVDNPYISIPVLASYLKARDIEVSAFDLNQALYLRLLKPQQIKKGLQYGLKRLRELNGLPKLTFSDLYEYWMLSRVLIQAEINKNSFDWLNYPFEDYLDIRDYSVHMRNVFAQVSTLPNFPEIAMPALRFDIKINFDSFCSEDLVKSSRHESEYTRIFRSLLIPLVEEKSPQFIGFSVVYRHQIIPAFQCSRIIKESFPGMYITLGGPFISTYMRNIKNEKIFSLIDSLVIDEGEIPLEKLAGELWQEHPDFSNIPGLIYLEKDKIKANDPAPILDLELQAPPDYAVFDLDSYPARKENLMVPFRLSKGCSWQRCSFCRTDLRYTNQFQQPSFSFVYRQLKQTIENTGLRDFLFSDESANPTLLEYISQRLIADNLKITWFCHTRVDKALSKERCNLFKEAGCKMLALGIESFNDRILRLMRKGTTTQLIEEVLSEIDGTIPLIAYMIVGFPTETEEEALAGFDTFKKFREKKQLFLCHYNICMIIYGSDIYRNPVKYGISEMYTPPEQDLRPDIYNYKGLGMPRKRAYQLMLNFNEKYEEIQAMDSVKKISYLGEEIAMRFNFRELKSQIYDKWDSCYLPFSSWLEKWENAQFTLEETDE